MAHELSRLSLISRLFFLFIAWCKFFLLAIQGFPLLSFNSLVDRLAQGTPIRVDQRRTPPPPSNLRGVDDSASYTSFFCSPCHLARSFSDNCSWEVCRELSLHHLAGFLCLNAGRPLSLLELPEPVYNAFAALFSKKPVTIFTTGLSSPFRWFVNSFKELIKLLHIPCGAACARHTCASRGSTLSCTTKTLCGALQTSWPPQAAHHQLHCFCPCAEETRQRSPPSG